MVSSVAMADEVNTSPTSEITATAQPVATNTSTPTTTSEEGATTGSDFFAIGNNTNCNLPLNRSVQLQQLLIILQKSPTTSPLIKRLIKVGEDVRISINNPEVVSSDITVSHLDQVIYERKTLKVAN